MDESNQAPFEEQTDVSKPLQDDEMQCQVSIKAPVWRHMFETNLDTFVSYAARSYWQLFNDDFSAPFPEFDEDQRLEMEVRLDYPPEGSPDFKPGYSR